MRTLIKAIVGLSIALSALAPSGTQAALPRMGQAGLERVSFEIPTAGPFAYTHFCLRYSDDCRVHNRQFRRPRPVALTDMRRHDLAEVNSQVNRSIRPKRYVNDTSFDTWRIAPTAGDCNDFAITKRHELLARGWPSRALLLAEVITPWGEHHLVLLVRTEHQDLVLDNLNANIKPWSKTSYGWVRAQSPYDTVLWSTIKMINVT